MYAYHKGTYESNSEETQKISFYFDFQYFTFSVNAGLFLNMTVSF